MTAKSARPSRVRQQPPEARCCTLTGLTVPSGKGGIAAPSSPQSRACGFSRTSAQGSPEGLGGWPAAPSRSAAGGPAAFGSARGQGAFALCPLGCRGRRSRVARASRSWLPVAPIPRALGFAVGVQEEVPAQGAASFLLLEQADRVRALLLPTPCGPVPGQSWVAGGRPALDQVMADNLVHPNRAGRRRSPGCRIPTGLSGAGVTGRSTF